MLPIRFSTRSVEPSKRSRKSRRASLAWLGALGAVVAARPAPAEEFTRDPAHWRPVHYFDLQFPAGEAEHFASLWADRLDANDKAYAAKGDMRFAVGHAPASEAHFSVNFQSKFVVLSVLDTSTDCRPLREFPESFVIVRRCPLRLATWENRSLSIVETIGCFLERMPAKASLDPTAAVSYVSYDITAKAFRTGLVVQHAAIPECALTIPLRASPEPK